MTLKEIGDGIEKSIKENKPLMIDGEHAIRKIEGQLYFARSFLIRYGDIVRLKLREIFWEEVKKKEVEKNEGL